MLKIEPGRFHLFLYRLLDPEQSNSLNLSNLEKAFTAPKDHWEPEGKLQSEALQIGIVDLYAGHGGEMVSSIQYTG
jgi:hypothetical protein